MWWHAISQIECVGDGTLLVMILPPIGDSAALIIGDKGVQGASICWAVPSFLENYFCIRLSKALFQ
jgi:hypothetical protein